jgi:hypothetical protein
MSIYVASSWRNDYQPGVVVALRAAGYDVYDFRNPRPGDKGFHWSEIDADWQNWTPGQYKKAIRHPIAVAGFASDFEAMQDADACVLVLPCGRSAHLEAGWFSGQGKPLIVFIPVAQEPELMNKLAGHICTSMNEVIVALDEERVSHKRTHNTPNTGATDGPQAAK